MTPLGFRQGVVFHFQVPWEGPRCFFPLFLNFLVCQLPFAPCCSFCNSHISSVISQPRNFRLPLFL